MYKLTSVTSIIRILDGMFIPNDPENTYYSEYIEWIAKGNTPLPADQVPNPAITAIDAQLIELDKRKIRPLAEGDTVYLEMLNTQTIELRAARALLPKMV